MRAGPVRDLATSFQFRPRLSHITQRDRLGRLGVLEILGHLVSIRLRLFQGLCHPLPVRLRLFQGLHHLLALRQGALQGLTGLLLVQLRLFERTAHVLPIGLCFLQIAFRFPQVRFHHGEPVA